MSIRSIIRGWFGASRSESEKRVEVSLPVHLINVPEEGELKGALADLKGLEEIMVADGEENFVRGVRITIEHLERAVAEPGDAQVAFSLGAETYQSMWGGMGSLSEFYVMNGSPEELEGKRVEYDALVKRLRTRLFPQ